MLVLITFLNILFLCLIRYQFIQEVYSFPTTLVLIFEILIFLILLKRKSLTKNVRLFYLELI